MKKYLIILGIVILLIGAMFYFKVYAAQAIVRETAAQLPEVANVGVGSGAVYRDQQDDRLNFRTLEPMHNISIQLSENNNMVEIGTTEDIKIAKNLYLPATGSEGVLVVDKDGKVSIKSFKEFSELLAR